MTARELTIGCPKRIPKRRVVLSERSTLRLLLSSLGVSSPTAPPALVSGGRPRRSAAARPVPRSRTRGRGRPASEPSLDPRYHPPIRLRRRPSVPSTVFLTSITEPKKSYFRCRLAELAVRENIPAKSRRAPADYPEITGATDARGHVGRRRE